MGHCLSFHFLFILSTLNFCVMGTFYRESHYRTPDLQGDDVTINVISEIMGDITWISTNEDHFSVTVKLSAPNFDVLNSTKVSFNSENSVVSMEIRTIQRQEVAAVHSTGSRIISWTGNTNYATMLFLLTLAVIFDHRFMYPIVMTLILVQMCNAVVPNNGGADHRVNISIRAPKHFRYKSINLVVNGGKVWVAKEVYKYTQDIRCSTDLYTKGCDGCCHGNGVCFNNTCLCEENYDAGTNCKDIRKREIFFISTFDPRLEKTILPSGLVLDLSTGDNSRDIKLRGRNPNHAKLRVRDMAAAPKDGMFHFNENGVLKRARYDKVSFVLKRRKESICYVDVVLKKFGVRIQNFTLYLCNNSLTNNKTEFIFNITKPFDNGESKISDHLSDIMPSRHTHFRSVPVKFERCGYDNQGDVSIYFKVQNNEMGSDVERFYKDDIYLHTTFRNDKHYLKIPSRNVSQQEIQRKCQRSHLLRNNICREDLVTFYKYVCDSIIYLDTNVTSDGTNKTINKSEAVGVCNFLLETLKTYCPSINLIDEHFIQSSSQCLSRYTDTVDLFSQEYVTLNPSIVLENGQTIQKESVMIPILNISRTIRTEIVLKEDIPEFKILKIAVIPNDPVPGDIYKVRFDYACATNETVIQMNVSGSDKYNSHVTCRGTNECNCCSIHAAGAADAVIDYVSINITDHLAKTDLYKEMVVIF